MKLFGFEIKKIDKNKKLSETNLERIKKCSDKELKIIVAKQYLGKEILISGLGGDIQRGIVSGLGDITYIGDERNIKVYVLCDQYPFLILSETKISKDIKNNVFNLKEKLKKNYLIDMRKVTCIREHCCKNAGIKCMSCICKFNLSLPIIKSNYDSTVECSICGNTNVIKGYKCNNCGEDVDGRTLNRR